MQPQGPLAKRIHDAVLRHLYERQVQQGKWGADYHLAKQDIAKMVERPMGSTLESSNKGGTRRFDWGFESQFNQVLEDLTNAGYLEIRLMESNGLGPSRTRRIRDYKLTPHGIVYVQSLNLLGESVPKPIVTDSAAGAPLPSDVAAEHGAVNVGAVPNIPNISNDRVESADPPDALPALENPPPPQQV